MALLLQAWLLLRGYFIQQFFFTISRKKWTRWTFYFIGLRGMILKCFFLHNLLLWPGDWVLPRVGFSCCVIPSVGWWEQTSCCFQLAVNLPLPPLLPLPQELASLLSVLLSMINKQIRTSLHTTTGCCVYIVISSAGTRRLAINIRHDPLST